VSELRPVTFTVFGTPAPAGSKRGFYNAPAGRVIVTDANQKARPWKAQVADKAAETMNGRPLLEGPLLFDVVFWMPRPKGHIGAKGVKPSAPPAPTVKPDLLKLARAVEDALTGVVWRDDAQIVTEVLQKAYTAAQARVEVRIATVTEPSAHTGSVLAREIGETA